jgi:hypothetical protein
VRAVRNAKTGDLAEIVEKDGQEVVVFPGRQGHAPIPYKPHEWVEEAMPRAMSRMQSAEIAYLADQGLQRFLGEIARAKKPWIALRQEDRIKFCDEGPQEPKVRRLLYKVVMGALAPLRKEP